MSDADRLKRALDITASGLGLVITAPIQLVTAAAVLAAHGRPMLFRQARPGKDGRVFELVKFRTMRHPDATHLTDAERLTRVGRFLRATSLDELPTLWNVLRGDMSLVGPRPLLVEYLERYTPEQARRHEVRPGITGLAQVSGRNAISWEERLELDVEYVDNHSLPLDLRILIRTLTSVLRREGISAQGEATMPAFTGLEPGEDDHVCNARGTAGPGQGARRQGRLMPGRRRFRLQCETSAKPSRVGFISQWYWPEPATLPTQFAGGLKDAGWEVRVLTGFPNYPNGKVQKGYRGQIVRREVIDGVPVLRTHLYASHDRSAARRMINYLSWCTSATLGALVWLRRVDINLVYGSPITAALPAIFLQLLRGTPFVIQVQDLWPDSISDSGFLRLSNTLDRVLRRICMWVYRQAAACIVISPGMADILAARGLSSEKIQLIYNWTDEDNFRAIGHDGTMRQRLHIPTADRVAMYVGNLGPAQGLDRWIEALKEVDHCHLVFVGDGLERSRLVTLAETLGVQNVHFYGAVLPHEVAALIAESDAQVVSLVDRPVFEATMPSKVQTSLACGSPVLAAVGGDVGRLIAEADAGIAVQPGDVASIRNALLQLAAATDAQLNVWGHNSELLYGSTMSRRVGLAALAKLLRSTSNTPMADRMKNVE